jgi:carbon monoxide dehydrogenase subunit G
MSTKVEKSITVEVPISTAYNQWTQFEEFPNFMSGVQKVEQLDDQRLHWVAEIAGVRREWYATILEQRADEKVAWAATEGATNAGAVYFTNAGPSRTAVTLELEYEPEGLVEKAGDALRVIERQAESDLERFKSFIESRGTESGAWRGEVGAPAVGTPGVELASSQGDSGSAGISPKVAVAGAAVAAAGVAAAAAAVKSGSGDSGQQSVPDTATTATPATRPQVELSEPEVEPVSEVVVVEEVADPLDPVDPVSPADHAYEEPGVDSGTTLRGDG